MKEILFEICNLEKTFKYSKYGLSTQKVVYQNVNLTIRKGTTYGLYGENGSGKSTFLKHISGIFRDKKAASETVFGGLLSQHPAALEGFSIEYNFYYMCTLHRVKKSKKELDQVLKSFLDFYSLERNDLFLILSSGMRAHLCILVVIQKDADIFLFDESTNGLDKNKIAMFKNGLHELKDRGKTIIFASHDVDFLKEISDSYIVCENSSIQARSEI